MITILIVEDQALVREGLIKLINLNSDHEVIGEAANGEEALDLLAKHSPDLIITDIQMPVMNGIDLIQKLRSKANHTPVLVLTTFDDTQLLIGAIKAGCNGFLLKDVSLERLNQAIKTVANGGYLIEPQSTSQDYPSDTKPQEALSETELQILRLAAAGFSNKEIGECMHLASGTVKNYISRILEKTHSRDRTQAVVKAMQWTLI